RHHSPLAPPTGFGVGAWSPDSIAGRVAAPTARCGAVPLLGSGRGIYHTGGYVQGLPGRYRLGWRSWLGPKINNANTATTASGRPAKTSAVCATLTSTR